MYKTDIHEERNMMQYCKVLAVTDRHLCEERDFLEQIGKVASLPVEGIILREKDLPEAEYEELAQAVMGICRRAEKKCILHSFPSVAKHLGAEYLHVPLQMFRQMPEFANEFREIGVSVHSAKEAAEAEKFGASYVVAGHIFATDCKKGVPPRGLEYLREICKTVKIPVYGIGGITGENLPEVLKTGAAGGCMMSGFMRM